MSESRLEYAPNDPDSPFAVAVRGRVDEVISQSELHDRSGGLLRRYYRDGGLVIVRDRWGREVAAIVIGPAMDRLVATDPASTSP